MACAALVLLAALCAAAEGLELWKRPPRYKGPRMFRVGDNASRVGLLALLLVACRIISLHAVSHEVCAIDGRRRAAPPPRRLVDVFATVGARPDLGDILRRANEELGADADVLIGGPQRLVDGLEDRLKGRVVERMTWAM